METLCQSTPASSERKKISDDPCDFPEVRSNQWSRACTLSRDDKKKKSDEWDIREREWTDELKRQTSSSPGNGNLKKTGGNNNRSIRKFNPKNRFRLMLVCLSILIISTLVLWLTVFDVNATLQATISMFTTIISGVIFVVNYGKDIIVTLLNEYTKSSLR
jgi:hypothetical protein